MKPLNQGGLAPPLLSRSVGRAEKINKGALQSLNPLELTGYMRRGKFCGQRAGGVYTVLHR